MQADSATTLVINGGEINVRTEGDGIDSNGSFEMNGGTLVVMGPTKSGNGSLDVNGSAVITGGTVVMAGASGMATNFTGASQGTMLINTGNQSEGTDICVKDSSGNEIVKVTADCSYQTVLISSPELTAGNNYTFTAGNYEESITLDDYISGGGSGFGPGGMMPDGAPGGMNGGDPGAFPGGGRGNRPQ